MGTTDDDADDDADDEEEDEDGDDEGDDEANARHAHLAYRHQLNAVQYAEIAVMDNESLEDAIEDAMNDAPMGEPAKR